jgi:hypothetical protein
VLLYHKKGFWQVMDADIVGVFDNLPLDIITDRETQPSHSGQGALLHPLVGNHPVAVEAAG